MYIVILVFSSIITFRESDYSEGSMIKPDLMMAKAPICCYLPRMHGPPYISSFLLKSVDTIHHGFFGRQGGVSKGVFESLNCSFSSGDNAADIAQNRQRVLECLGSDSLFTLRQMHGNQVVCIDARSHPEQLVAADGMVTDRQGTCLGVLGADCAPVLFVDGQAGVIGIAHAGWKGALAGITDSVIAAMDQLGAKRDRILCAIGPAIQRASYAVGRQFKESLIDSSPVVADAFFRTDPITQTVYFDLPGYIQARVSNSGVDRIHQLEHDTYRDKDRFFSYRRNCHENQKLYGRQVSVIGLVD